MRSYPRGEQDAMRKRAFFMLSGMSWVKEIIQTLTLGIFGIMVKYR